MNDKTDSKLAEKPNPTVINFTERLKLVAHNKRKREKKKQTRGQKAIDQVDYLNETARRILAIDRELQKPRQNTVVLPFIQWYLEEFVDQKPKNDTQVLFNEFANILLIACIDRQIHVINKIQEELDE